MTPRNPPRGKPLLHTPRLLLRPLSWEDLPALTELDADAEVMRYVDAPRTADQVRERQVARMDPSHDAMGLGYWAGLEQSQFIGWWLLTPEGPGWGEIGWRLHRFAWGRGLATEGAAAIVRHGFETVGLDRIVAETMMVNDRSRSVMAKLGMRHTGCEQGEWLAEITRADWQAGQSTS